MWACFKNPKPASGCPYEPTILEHWANLVTHGLLIPPSFFALFYLTNKAHTMAESMVAFIYGLATLALFSTSSSYHFASLWGKYERLKRYLHIGDRVIIYFFIAASYTPWLALRDFHDGWGEFTLFLVWFGAFLGITLQYIFHESRHKMVLTLMYLVVGIFPSYTVIYMHEQSGVYELAFGGLLYLFGVIFFKSDGLIPMSHAIWHCFVFAGAIIHFHAIDKYLIGNSQPPILPWLLP